jgi:hypothetical protein
MAEEADSFKEVAILGLGAIKGGRRLWWAIPSWSASQ